MAISQNEKLRSSISKILRFFLGIVYFSNTVYKSNFPRLATIFRSKNQNPLEAKKKRGALAHIVIRSQQSL